MMMKTDWSNLNYWTNRESLHDDNDYIWDGRTVPAWRGQRCSSARLSRIIYRLHREGCPTHLDRGSMPERIFDSGLHQRRF
jgi:hypothetical protein